MWIDDAGVLHTVALAEPTAPMKPEFRAGLDVIIAERRTDLRAILELAEDRAYDFDWSNLPIAEAYIAASPPADLLQGSVVRPEHVAEVVADVDPRWRPDAILAIGDYVDRR